MSDYYRDMTFAQSSMLMQLEGTLERCMGDPKWAAASQFLASSWLFTSPEDRAAVCARTAWDARSDGLAVPADAYAKDLQQAARLHETRQPAVLFAVEPAPHGERGVQLRAAVFLLDVRRRGEARP